MLFACLTIDVEEWFHILDSPAVPNIEKWPLLESRIERNLERLLDLLESKSLNATFFWLGWLAERQKKLVRRCRDAGHEIASHGYAHVLAYEVGPGGFREDISRAKNILEDIIGEPVRGFRTPGFGVTKKSPWVFDVIAGAGYQYDSSVFPAAHGHGGLLDSPLGIYFVETHHGHLLEVPMSIVEIFHYRMNLFGGGYLRLANKFMIKWGIDRLASEGHPLIVYIHPREIDLNHPHLSLSMTRRFKCYVNLKSTMPKLQWLCQQYSFYTMLEMVENYIRSFYLESRTIPVMSLREGNSIDNDIENGHIKSKGFINPYVYRKRLLQLEEAMASFISPGLLHETLKSTSETRLQSSM